MSRAMAFIEEDSVKITVVAVGKLKERFWADACAEYVKRLSAYASIKMVEIPDRDPAKTGGEEAGRALEGKAILAAIPERSHVVLLDIGGKERSSEEIASHLNDLMLRGESSITFVIGGSCGVSSEVRARADERLSFGRITLPHNLARVVLLEQVYRAFKIMRGEPYHK
ncbi:23S rRNA (pseudouridine(1915)-N(3))-methyltransferase RlmH [Collinsella sp. AF08-23]|uniref:23S rRNA (pseudouridine(1915)-N(3))-methyltransferase RlmH n=2 Tax=Coriobacteriaceae TaxID=84107 RepID=UPI002101B214|nr:23S rRNA (pseudouridine(1915)-N(3))-methyltransferase RlmH [Collinsella sp. AF08-23]